MLQTPCRKNFSHCPKLLHADETSSTHSDAVSPAQMLPPSRNACGQQAFGEAVAAKTATRRLSKGTKNNREAHLLQHKSLAVDAAGQDLADHTGQIASHFQFSASLGRKFRRQSQQKAA